MKNTIFNNDNTKAKIFSLVTAIILWMYVIAVVDPEEKKVVEHIPITITNENELKNNDLIIYPKDTLNTDITLEGKLSELQKLNKNNINIYGDIINPVEGNNIVNLRTNISNRVSRELKDSSFVVNLEKKITKKVDVKIDIPDNLSKSIYSAVPEKMQVEVVGPRSLIKDVRYVGYSLSQSKIKEDQNDQVIMGTLIAYGDDNMPLDIYINPSKINIYISFVVYKEVDIKPKFSDDGIEEEDFSITPEKITILGSHKNVKDIKEIYTDKIDVEELKDVTNKKVRLVLPNNISVKNEIQYVELNKKQ